MVIKSIYNEVDLDILKLIKENKSTTFMKVAKTSPGTWTTINKSINKLVDKGIIKKEQNPESKREFLLTYAHPKLKIDEFIELLK